MSLDFLSRRLVAIAGFPVELMEYQRWLSEQKPRPAEQRDYLFADSKPRFEPRREDVVVSMPGLALARRSGKTLLVTAEPRVELVLDGIKARDAERILNAIDGRRCLLEVGWEAGVEAGALARFLRASFGKVVFAPAAVETLERRLSSAEICRFVAPPYAVERPYWENMLAVRERFLARTDALATLEAWMDLMRELHVLALMGANLQSFYKPASPVADEQVAPGAFFLDQPRLLESSRGTVFLDGPRVKVPLLGGARYHALLVRELDDPDAVADRRVHVVDGVDWGRVVTARGEGDAALAAWFCPPRPLTVEHFELLRASLLDARVAAAAGDRDQVVESLASFHQAWVRLHPFHCANQSVAMNIVGAVLGDSHGAGMPHGILDHFALRMTNTAYQRLFRRAVDAHVIVDADPAKAIAIGIQALGCLSNEFFFMMLAFHRIKFF